MEAQLTPLPVCNGCTYPWPKGNRESASRRNAVRIVRLQEDSTKRLEGHRSQSLTPLPRLMNSWHPDYYFHGCRWNRSGGTEYK
jgi:hypothetical protein